MTLTIGESLGRYRILSSLGSGGMGEVYRARDLVLARDVAIKVLPRDLARQGDRIDRLGREAQLLAALNHPHIAQVYGFEELAPGPGAFVPAVRALVMELVDGPTLADRISRAAMPLEEVLSIAHQLAEALEAAHERGIVHRDLKPANVKLTADGRVKVLDFGLAKLVNPRPAAAIAGDAIGPACGDSESTTIASETDAARVVGTAAYMSPEQARGGAVDKRSDIWAFGIVLYEMLSRRRPFDGATISDVVAAVLRDDIDWAPLPAGTPPGLRKLLRRCLERDVRHRLHDAADIRLALADLDFTDPQEARSGGSPWRPIVVATGMVMATLAAFGAGRSTVAEEAVSARPIAPIRFVLEPPGDVSTVSNVALSADGRSLTFAAELDGESRLYVHRLDAFASTALRGTEGARGPFLSPDGRWVGFFREGHMYKVSSDGGDPVLLCEVRGGPGASWGQDGRIVFARTWLGGLSIVSAEGGVPRVLTTPDAGRREIGHWWPSVLPDRRVLFTVMTATAGFNDAQVAVLDPASGRYERVIAGERASWLASGHLLFYRAGRYMTVPFDLASTRVTGLPTPVLPDALDLDPLGDWPQPLTATSDGALAYLTGQYVPPSRLTWIDDTGALSPLAFGARPFVGLRLSPDGRRVAAASFEGGRLLLRLLDLARATDEPLTIDGMNWNPAWLPDGRLSYTSMRKGDFDVYVKDAGGLGDEHALLTGPDDTDPVAWTKDGLLVIKGSEPDGGYPLKLYDPRAAARASRLTDQHVEHGGSLSPDDRWLVYDSAASGRALIYARPMAAGGRAAPLFPTMGQFPLFMRNGRTLTYLRGAQLVQRPWVERNGRFETGPERTIARLAYGSGWMYGAPYDAAADGRLLALVRTEGQRLPRIHVVVGFNPDDGRVRTIRSDGR